MARLGVSPQRHSDLCLPLIRPISSRRSSEVFVMKSTHAGLSFAKTLPGGQVIDLSAPIRKQFRLDDRPLAPRASTPPVPLRRPPPARGREPCPAAATGCVQKNDGPTQAAPDGSSLLDLAG